MGKKQRGGGMADVKSNLRRKLDERVKQKSSIGKGETKKAKPKKITCFFDPSEYVSTKPEMKDFRGVKGDQPEWVIEKYGKNC